MISGLRPRLVNLALVKDCTEPAGSKVFMLLPNMSHIDYILSLND